jgi:hypothetical protein
MDVISSSETLRFPLLTWRPNLEYHNLHDHRYKNLRCDRLLLADAYIGRIIASYSRRVQ